MTQPTYSQQGPPPPAVPKRKVGSRFTSGHLIMVVSGMLAFLLVLAVLRAGNATITVFIAKSDIVAGQRISLSQFDAKEIPSSDLNDAYVDKDEITSKKSYFASRSISKGDPLLDKSRTPEVNIQDVRLQSIPIDKSLAVSGKIAKGDRIDVLLTPEDDCAVRVLRNLEVVEVAAGSSGGALGGSSGGYVITVAIKQSGDDLTLAGVIASGSFQIVRSTGTSADPVLTDPYCENGLDESLDNSDAGSSGA
ncbi:MAG TPA: SAF domain-containing protein [Acidimicrobiia bacterium]|nr:SAF domain-containing protein [Acidimicrobiia bacterium]